MAEKGRSGRKIEGEGSREADRRYREGVTDHLRKGHVEEEAERAAREVAERPEDYRRAEEEGKKRSAGDLPEDLER
ncbi:MAG TPA: hypothetical protein VLC54_02760 [Anaeromyxobacter sp.]|nr:hypothetical protein [Anaeromyxobacter sp.]